MKILKKLTDTVQQDVREQETKIRVRKHFDENWELLQARSHKPHAAECVDPLLCEKEECFIWEPDKIVKTFVVNIPQPQSKLSFKETSRECKKNCQNNQYNRCYDCVIYYND